MKRILQTLAAGALMLATALPAAHGAGLLIADGGLGGVLEIEEQTVHVTVNNGIAVTDVTQVFRNTEQRQVEALYTFPVPRAASVSNFSMWIGGKEMVGEVLEKEKAREIYNSYKAVRRDPGLLEQTDYKTFEMRIFPIAAGAEQRVQVTYYQELDFDNDWATWVYPLATVSRPGIDSSVKGKFNLTIDVKSEVPIAELASPSHAQQFVIAKHTPHYAQASLEAAGWDLNRDLVLACRIERAKTGLDLIASRPASEDGYFCLTLTAGEELEQARSGMDYVFVVDISGSMANDGKLALSRGSVTSFIDALEPDDRFELIAFNVAPETLFGTLTPAAPEARSQAAGFLEKQQARGGTVLRPAIEAAYRYGDPDRPLNVVVLSDGMTEQQERAELLRMMAQKPTNARVFCVGVGNEVNQPLLRQLAEDAGGLAAFVSQGDDFARQAQAFRRKLMRPVASNIAVELAGADAYDLEPKQLPNLYHGAPVRLYGRYRKAGPVQVTLRAEVEGRPIETKAQLTLPERDDDNPEIERMWAYHRVQRLLGEGDRTGSRKGVLDEVVRLGEGYSIATEYTSFLVLENDAEYKRWSIERRNATRTERDRRKQARLRAELETLRDAGLANLGPNPGDAPKVKEVAMNLPQSVPAVENEPAGEIPVVTGRGFDIELPLGGGGGGAVDPLTVVLALACIVIATFSRHRRC